LLDKTKRNITNTRNAFIGQSEHDDVFQRGQKQTNKQKQKQKQKKKFGGKKAISIERRKC